MAGSSLPRVLDRLPSAGARRPELFDAAYRSAFRVDESDAHDA